VLPKQNEKNIKEDLTEELRKGLTVHLVTTVDEVLALALQPASSDRRPLKKESKESKEPMPSGAVAARP
jgi:ATP-dependent Lon protease